MTANTGEITPEQFAQSIAQQAMQAVPPDIPQQGASFIGNIVFNFAKLAGEALVNEKTDPNIASQLTTFIGEWTFHKGIDLVRAKIPPQLIEQPILQKVAFGIFETGKKAYAQNLPQEEVLQLIEDAVKNTYKDTLLELQNAGQLKPEMVDLALNQSNIDNMAKAQAQEKFDKIQTIEEEDKILQETEPTQDMTKESKYIATAILLKNIPDSKKAKVLSILGEDAQNINKYNDLKQLNVLEKNMMVKRNLEELKQKVGTLKKKCFTKENTKLDPLDIKIKELKQTLSKEELYDLVKFERQNVIEHVCGNSGKNQVSSYISTAIYKYLKEQVAKNDN